MTENTNGGVQPASEIVIRIPSNGQMEVKSNMPLPVTLGFLRIAEEILLSQGRGPQQPQSPIVVAKGPLHR